MSEKDIAEWLLKGGGGFEGTPEASTFTFNGVVSLIDSYAESLTAQLDAEKARGEELKKGLVSSKENVHIVVEDYKALNAVNIEMAGEIKSLQSRLRAAEEALKKLSMWRTACDEFDADMGYPPRDYDNEMIGMMEDYAKKALSPAQGAMTAMIINKKTGEIVGEDLGDGKITPFLSPEQKEPKP